MAERVIRDEMVFPTDLEERLGVVLNGINTELKIATLLHLDVNPVDGRGIRERIRDTIGCGYLPFENAFRRYMETLQGIALVARETVIGGGGDVVKVSYSITDAGSRYGIPVAEHALRWGVDNGVSMFQVLGSTLSSGNSRAPYNRVRILEGAYTGETNEADLGRILGLNSTSTSHHLISLARIGFLNFSSAGAKPKGFSVYELINDSSEVPQSLKRRRLGERVVEWLKEKGEGDRNIIREELGCIPQDVSSILASLERWGVVRKKSGFKGNLRSKVLLLDEGKRFLEEVIFPIREHLRDGESLGNLLSNSDEFGVYVRNGIEIYSLVSPQINKRSKDERIEEVRRILDTSSGMTTREIGERLGLSNTQVLNFIRSIGGIETRKEGMEIKYYLSGGE
ncbi:MAG: hypothetical protein Q8P57_02790 [Candidatus Pacearchaeota archaeon]|nr:hypothetical protein [Candidatus Pacearchaeota archaeon]